MSALRPPRPGSTARDRVDIRPTALLLAEHVERHGVEVTCERYGLCRRRMGAIVARRTTRGQHAHFLDRACVEDILTQGPDVFGTLHVPLAGALQARLTELFDTLGAEALAERLGVHLPRAAVFAQQITLARAGNGARVTHVCASVAEHVGLDPASLDDTAIERAWCPACGESVLVAVDRRCPWCDAAVTVEVHASVPDRSAPVPA